MTGPVSIRETESRVPVRGAADVCSFVDQLARHAAGELVVVRGGSVVRGAIFVEHGRVCWAAARGLAPRLTELLMAPSGVDARTMEDHFRRCREERVPLGEFLVARGIVRSEELRAALLQHTAESLAALCHEDAAAEWCPRPGAGYSARFTFRTSEILARSLAHAHRELTIDAERALATGFVDFTPHEWGAAFVRASSVAGPAPIALRGDVPDTATALVRVGKWAASALDLAGTFQGDDAFLATIERGGAALVAWREGRTIIAGQMRAQGPARILNRRAKERREALTAATNRTPNGRAKG